MKKSLWAFIIFIVLVVAAYFYFFKLRPIKQNNPLSAVPAEAAMIISLENPLGQWQALTNNEIWSYLKTNPILSSFGQSIDSLNREIKKNETILDLTANRPLVISAHLVVDPDRFELLYTIDLQKATQFSFLKDYLGNLSDEATKVYSRDYNGVDIMEISYQDAPTVYYICVVENLLSVSTIHTLIEKSIDERNRPTLIRDLDFVEVNNSLNTDKPAIYFQQQYFKKLLNSYFTTDTGENTLAFLTYTSFLGLNTSVNDEFISLSGFSNLPDNAPNLPQALITSGKGEINLGKIVPENASTFTSLGFGDADQFYENINGFLSSLEDGEDYIENRKKNRTLS